MLRAPSNKLPGGLRAIAALSVVSTLVCCGGPPTATQEHAAELPTKAAEPPAPVAPAKAPAPVTPVAPVKAADVGAAAPVLAPTASARPTEPAPTGLACTAQVPEGATLAERLDAYRAACGVLLVTREDGLHAMTPGLTPIAQISKTKPRWVQARREGEARELYYFAAERPELVRLDLRTGKEQVLVKLPRLKHACFTQAEPGEKSVPADPVDFIQGIEDIDIDVGANTLCLDIGDRNDNMVSMKLNFRADLGTGKVEQRTTLVGEECQKGAGREQEPACATTPDDIPMSKEIEALGGVQGLLSPSGKWALYDEENFAQMGDYVHLAMFLFDTQAKVSYAVTRAGLVKVDRATMKAAPKDTCYVVGEAAQRWMPDRDILVLDGCDHAPWLILDPPARVQSVVDALHVAIYP